MKIIFLIFQVIYSSIAFSQQYCMEDLPNTNLNRNDVSFLKSNEALLKKVTLSTVNPKCHWVYYLRQSVNRLYLNQDSSSYYLQDALKSNLKGTCKFISFSRTFFDIKKSEGNAKGFSCFYTSLPKDDQLLVDSLCQNIYNELTKEEEIAKDSTQNAEIIRKRDQKYRMEGKMEEQETLDQVNRDFIDSLYQVKGTIDAFNEEEIYQFSMVAHHSVDCDWVYKWTERFIELHNNGYTGKSILGPLLERMITQDGYCTEQDPQKRNYFIYMIKAKYPNFVKNNHQLNW